MSARRSSTPATVLLLVVITGCRIITPEERKQLPKHHEFVAASINGTVVRGNTRSWRSIQQHNLVMQRFDYSCGSAALATMLRYYFEDDVDEQVVIKAIFQRLGKADKPQEELKDRFDNGFSMLDLLNAGKDLGYQGAVVRLKLQKLSESQAPVIVRIEKFEYKHFVVVRGIYDRTVFLADPIRGNIRLSVQEFMQQWSGEALFLGKAGFGLPKDHPLALDKSIPARPELEVARQALYDATRSP